MFSKAILAPRPQGNLTTPFLVKQTKASDTLFSQASKQPTSPLNEPKTTNPHLPLSFYFYSRKHEVNKKSFLSNLVH